MHLLVLVCELHELLVFLLFFVVSQNKNVSFIACAKTVLDSEPWMCRIQNRGVETPTSAEREAEREAERLEMKARLDAIPRNATEYM